MTIAKNDGRQSPLVARVEFNFDDFVSGVFENAIELPAGAIVQGGNISMIEAFDSGTSDSLTVGDSVDEDRYLTATDAQALGLTALVPTGFGVTGIDDVTITLTSVGTPTAGIGVLTVSYVVPDRAQATQGN